MKVPKVSRLVNGLKQGKEKKKKKISSNNKAKKPEEEQQLVHEKDEEQVHRTEEETEDNQLVEALESISLSNQVEDQDREEDDEIHPPIEESDSSEDEVPDRNTIGDVPLKFYGDEEHIGYDKDGKKIKKRAKRDKLDDFLSKGDDSKSWRIFFDAYNDEEVEVLKEQAKLIDNLIKGRTPHANVDPYQDYVDWFVGDGAKHPLTNEREPKRRFTPSKSEHKMVVKFIKTIRKRLKEENKPKEESRFYLLWDNDSSSQKSGHGLIYIPPRKPKLPGHEESYNPSVEYIPTQEEINSYQIMYEEDRPKYIPRRFESLRKVPAYNNGVKESFERCLDLYLSPRIPRPHPINIDPESLKPKLPSRKDLRPYPVTCYLEYKGHKDAVMSISVHLSGQWLASGSTDGTVRIWEVETGRCIKLWEIGEIVQNVAWNPVPDLPVLAVCVGPDVLLLNSGLGSGNEQEKVKELMRIESPSAPDSSDQSTSFVSWLQHEKHDGIRLKHLKTVASVEWHPKGDYFSTLMPKGDSRSVVLHQLSRKLTQIFPFKLRGLPVSSVFHPSRPILFVSTKKSVRVYSLLKQELVRKLETGVREVSSFAIHPAGDNVIVGSREGKLCWFDMDLASKPYRVLKCHPKDITNVAYHRSYPLFASCSEDGTAYVFHGMVYSDLNQNPLIVPLEILRGHKRTNGRGVMDCTFHPRQPWLFTAGADSVIKLFCH